MSDPIVVPAVNLIDQTTLTFAQASVLASSKAAVERLNADLMRRYQAAYADYVANMQSGQNVPEERRHAPKPPNAWELAPPNSEGFTFYQIGTTPVMQQLPDVGANFDNKPVHRDPNHIHVGPAIPGGGGRWFSVGPDDGEPNGFITPPNTTSEDGVTGTFQKYGAPVGNGWYAKIG